MVSYSFGFAVFGTHVERLLSGPTYKKKNGCKLFWRKAHQVSATAESGLE
jgi:hypothetical protein